MRVAGFLVLSSMLEIFVQPAFAGPRDGEWIPPARYDHPYPGRLTIHKIPQPQLKAACNALFTRHDVPDKAIGDMRGCSAQRANRCEIIAVDRTYKGATPQAVVRHETGHCNGWPSNHPP